MLAKNWELLEKKTYGYQERDEEKRREFWRKLEKIEESIRKLGEEYNTLSYAVRISPEILTHIFLYVINDIYEKNMAPIHQLRIPHVCRHWYKVASYSQQYWRYQPLQLEGERRFQAPHLVERAGGRPLHLWGDVFMDSCWDLSTCDLISQQLSQAESVNISTRPQKRFQDLPNLRAPPYLATFLKKKAPNLRELCLLKDQKHDPLSIDADAFEGETPNLYSLYLSGFSWAWSAPLFPPSLTSLILAGPVAWGEDCIQTLRRLPFLQYLGLEDTTGTTPSDERAHTEVVIPSNPSPSVKLDRLETLVLAKDGTVDTGMARLSLDIPSSTVVLLKSRHLPFPGGNSGDAYPELGPLFSFSQRCLESHQRDHILTGILHVRTELDDSSDANFRLWFTQERISFDDFWNLAETTPTNFQLILISSNDPHDNPQQPIISYPEVIIARVVSQLPLSSIHTLYLEGIPSISDAGKAFQSLSGVQTLIINSGDAIRILRDLIPALPSGKIQSEEGILLPALSTIIYSSLLGPAFYYLWIYAGSGNANFFYAITLVWTLGLVVITADVLYAILRDEWEVERPEMRGKEAKQI